MPTPIKVFLIILLVLNVLLVIVPDEPIISITENNILKNNECVAYDMNGNEVQLSSAKKYLLESNSQYKTGATGNGEFVIFSKEKYGSREEYTSLSKVVIKIKIEVTEDKILITSGDNTYKELSVQSLNVIYDAKNVDYQYVTYEITADDEKYMDLHLLASKDITKKE